MPAFSNYSIQMYKLGWKKLKQLMAYLLFHCSLKPTDKKPPCFGHKYSEGDACWNCEYLDECSYQDYKYHGDK